MPKFLEAKLKKEYPGEPAAPYKIMNKLGAMHGNKITPKGEHMEALHEAKMHPPKVSVKPRGMRLGPSMPRTDSHPGMSYKHGDDGSMHPGMRYK